MADEEKMNAAVNEEVSKAEKKAEQKIADIKEEAKAEVKEAKAEAKEAKEEAAAAAAKTAADAKAEKKAAKEEEKKQKKIEKKAKKAAELQSKIEQCPKDYKPVSTGKYFWIGFLCYLPVIGIIFTILFSIIPRNKNIKHFARAILAAFVIILILVLIGLIALQLTAGDEAYEFLWPLEKFIEDMASAFGI